MSKIIIDVFNVFGDENFQKSLVVIIGASLVLSISLLLYRFKVWLMEGDAVFLSTLVYGMIVFLLLAYLSFTCTYLGV
ncbi:MAG: hypothetical protein HDR12_06315 [Lachnospiraceae bacterium]|nr:hypothetical protein [Lachnospiraceae bacterium]